MNEQLIYILIGLYIVSVFGCGIMGFIYNRILDSNYRKFEKIKGENPTLYHSRVELWIALVPLLNTGVFFHLLLDIIGHLTGEMISNSAFLKRFEDSFWYCVYHSFCSIGRCVTKINNWYTNTPNQ